MICIIDVSWFIFNKIVTLFIFPPTIGMEQAVSYYVIQAARLVFPIKRLKAFFNFI